MPLEQIKENALYQVLIGQTKLGDAKTALLKVIRWCPETEHWICETESGKEMKVKDVARFLKEIKPKAEKEFTPPKERPPKAIESTTKPQIPVGSKDAAYWVLRDEQKPLRAKDISDLVHQRGYCNLPGLTPWMTIASALNTDINVKGKRSRFKKIGPGLFALNDKQQS